MAREFSCPQCPQVLTVPDSLVGQAVRCPQCGGLYRTTTDGQLVKEELAAVPAAAKEGPPGAADSFPTAQDREAEQYVRRDVVPHRGNVILLLGILSLAGLIILFCPPLPAIGAGLGLMAWWMANTDLQKMSKGVMDPGGEGSTNAGKICGILGMILNGLILLSCGTYLGAMLIWTLTQDLNQPPGNP